MSDSRPDLAVIAEYLHSAGSPADPQALAQLAALSRRASPHALHHAGEVWRRLMEWSLPPQTLLAAVTCSLAPGEADLRALSPLLEPRASQAAQHLCTLHGEVARQLRAHSGPIDVQRTLLLRHLFIQAYRSPELVLCVLADRLATLEMDLKTERGRTHIEPFEDVFQPLLEMMGMWDELRKVGDSCAQALRPAKFEQLHAQISRNQAAVQDSFDQIKARLEARLRQEGMDPQLRWHQSRVFSVMRRQAQGDPLLPRRVRVDVLVQHVQECYRALGALYALWPSLSSHLTDRICQPRFNAYRALTTTQRCPDCSKEEVEFYIMTHQQDAINHQGIVAARYRQATREPVPAAWWEDESLRALLQAEEEQAPGPQLAPARDPGGEPPAASPPAAKQVWVFSPIGEVFRFDVGSTPIDYAFRIHSDRALYSRGIWVNGEEKDHAYQLRNGDVVRIEFDDTYPGPNRQWLDTAKSALAKSLIRHALSRSQGARNRGERLLEEALEREETIYKTKIPREVADHWIQDVCRQMGYATSDSLYRDIAHPGQAERKPSADKIVRRLLDREMAKGLRESTGGPLPVPGDRVSFARCGLRQVACGHLPQERKTRQQAMQACRILPGDPIVGYLRDADTRYQRLVVYKQDCPQAPAGARRVAMDWRPEVSHEMVTIDLSATDRPRLLEDMLAPVYDLYGQGLYLYDVQADADPLTGLASVSIMVSIPTVELLDRTREAYKEMMSAGRIGDFAINSLSPETKLRLVRGRASRRYQNPYREGVASETVFVGRFEEIDRIVHTLEGGTRLVGVIGQKRMGKTSLLLRLHKSVLPQRGFRPFFVDMRRVTDFSTAGIIATIARELGADLPSPREAGRPLKRQLPKLDRRALAEDPFGEFERTLKRLQETFPSEPLVLMLDEFTVLDLASRQGRLEAGFFDGFRSLVEKASGARFILAIQEVAYRRAEKNLAGGWADLQSATLVPLGPLDQESAVRLIREPKGDVLRYEEAVVRQILELTDRHPYYLQIILNRIVSRKVGQSDVSVRPDDLQAILPGILEVGDVYFGHFKELLDERKRALLVALARASTLGHTWIGATEIDGLAGGARDSLTTALLTELHRDGILAAEQREQPSYRLRVPLFAQWLLCDS